MLPCFAPKQCAHDSRGDTIFGSQFSVQHTARSVAATRLYDLLLGKFGGRMVFAMIMATLRYLVGNVVCMCSGKKMRWVTARRIVTLMTNYGFAGDWAIGQFVSNAVRQKSGAALFANAYPAIAKIALGTLPFPTVNRPKRLNLQPKAFSEWLKSGVVSVDVVQWLALDPSATLIGCVSYARFLSATTAAITVWDFVRGMILHVNSPFLTLTTPQDGSTHRCGNYLPVSIIPQEAAL